MFSPRKHPPLDAGDTREAGAASPPAGVKTEEAAEVKEEGTPRLAGQKRVKAEDESDDSDARPAKTAKTEEHVADAPPMKPVAVPRVCSVRK